MCYSAEASFIASGVLTATSLSIARIPKEKVSLPLSFIPAIFATHQFIEGIIWLSQSNKQTNFFETAAVSLYVLIAYVFWPIFIPYTAYRMEPEKVRRSLILLCQAVGILVGLGYLLGMLRSPLGVSVCSNNLSYQVNSLWDIGPAYIIAVTLPFLVSSQRGLVLFGLAVLGSAAGGLYFESLPSFPSVWCFFAAVLSAGLYTYFRAANQARIPQISLKTYTR